MTKKGINRKLSSLAETQANLVIDKASGADQVRRNQLAESKEAQRIGALRAAGVKVDF